MRGDLDTCMYVCYWWTRTHSHVSRTLLQQDGWAPARRASRGRALMLIGMGHGVWGAVAYREPLREVVRAGVADSVGDGLFRRAHSDDARAAAFWFMFVAPMATSLGYLVERASRAGDGRAVKAGGWSVIAMGAIGVAVMPRSGFVTAPPLGYWMLREGSRLAP